MLRSTIIILALLVANTVIAQKEEVSSNAPIVRFLFSGFLELGGDEVAEVLFTNGESQSVNAAQGGTISAGARFEIPAVSWLTVDATIGFKYVTTQAENANIRMTRMPINLMLNYKINKDFALSVGVSNHQLVKFYADGLGDDLAFAAATGPRFEFSYKGVGLSYTLMNYTAPSNEVYAANGIGLGYTHAFGKK